MKASDYIIQYLGKQGTKVVFGYIGGAITHLVDSADKSDSLKFVQVYHEQTAAFAAEGYAINSGKVGVAMATSGPGATNLITGIADAYFDSIPVVFITGQVNTYEYKYDKPIRQQGFQETDIVSIVKPITKYAKIIDKPEMICVELEKAFYLATSGRPGPVLLDIPMDIQRAEINPKSYPDSFKEDYTPLPIKSVEEVKNLLKQSKRPIILAGGGVRMSQGEKELLIFSRNNSIPVVTSLMGKGSFPEESDLFVGMIGSYGNRCANMILSNADLLIALGTRLDTRQVGTLLESFLREGKVIHVEIDDNEIKHNRLKRYLKIKANLKTLLTELNNMDYKKTPISAWENYIKKIKNEYSQNKEIEKNCDNKLPYTVMDVLNQSSGKNQVYCIDIGQNQMFAAQSLKIKEGQKFLTSGGMAPMGYAIPIAVGASFSDKSNKSIWAIVGDGGLHISTQSLMLISQYKLPIKVIVLNNHALGMIAQFQDLYFDERKVATTKEGGYLVPDIKSLAKSYNLKYYRLDKNNINDLEKIMKSVEACLVEVVIDEKTVVCPKLEVNTPIEDLNPKLDKKELQEMMLIKLYDKK